MARWRPKTKPLVVAVSLSVALAVAIFVFWPSSTPPGRGSLSVLDYRVVSNRLVARLVITNGPNTVRFAADRYSIAWGLRPPPVERSPPRLTPAQAKELAERRARPRIYDLTVTNISKTILAPAETATVDVWLPQWERLWQVKLRFYEVKYYDYLPQWSRAWLPISMRRTNRVELATGFIALTEEMLPKE